MFTILVTCNAAGTGRRPLLVLSKSQNPHCFRTHDVRQLVHYMAQSNAWMDAPLFTGWLDTFNRWCQNQGRCIALLMDNASAHMTSSGTAGELHGLGVRYLFLPANTTSIIQPYDQGIIRSLKAAYRRCLVEWQYQKWSELRPLPEQQRALSAGGVTGAAAGSVTGTAAGG